MGAGCSGTRVTTLMKGSFSAAKGFTAGAFALWELELGILARECDFCGNSTKESPKLSSSSTSSAESTSSDSLRREIFAD